MEALPDKNLFMMCKALRKEALSDLPTGYSVRSCRPEELPIWKSMPFDDALTAAEYEGFMEQYFQTTYGGKEDVFFANTLFVCDAKDHPIATGLVWRAYDAFMTLHWFKVVKAYEGRGIGRALLSILMRNVKEADYPVYLHTQPESYRAIKLYSDFGFSLLTGSTFGSRQNDLEECLPILKNCMPEQAFQQLRIVEPPESFGEFLTTTTSIQF
jgi:GNAT superfamily N-acetyltransferase